MENENLDKAKEYLLNGEIKSDNCDYEGAIEDFNKVIALKPDDYHTYLKRGLAKQYIADYQGALEDFDKALELKPEFGLLYSDKADVLLHGFKNYQEAIENYNKAIELKPEEAVYYVHRGVAKYKLKDYQGAMDDYNKAIELYPSNNPLYGYNIGEVYLKMAMVEFGRALENMPDDEGAMYYKNLLEKEFRI